MTLNPWGRKAPQYAPEHEHASILRSIQAKSNLISQMQKEADLGKLKNVEQALGLQRLRMDRAMLQGMLPPFKLVNNDNPDF